MAFIFAGGLLVLAALAVVAALTIPYVVDSLGVWKVILFVVAGVLALLGAASFALGMKARRAEHHQPTAPEAPAPAPRQADDISRRAVMAGIGAAYLGRGKRQHIATSDEEPSAKHALGASLRYRMDGDAVLSIENRGPTIPHAQLRLLAPTRPERRWLYRKRADGMKAPGLTSDVQRELLPGLPKSLLWSEKDLELAGYRTTELVFFLPRYAGDPIHVEIGSDELEGWRPWVFATPPDTSLVATDINSDVELGPIGKMVANLAAEHLASLIQRGEALLDEVARLRNEDRRIARYQPVMALGRIAQRSARYTFGGPNSTNQWLLDVANYVEENHPAYAGLIVQEGLRQGTLALEHAVIEKNLGVLREIQAE
jgi:hypothetical protein